MRRFPGSASRTRGVWGKEATRSQIVNTYDLETTPNPPASAQVSSPHNKAKSPGSTSRQKNPLSRAANASGTQGGVIPELLNLREDYSTRNPLPIPPRMIPPYDPRTTSYEDRLEFLRGQSIVMPAAGSPADDSGSDEAQTAQSGSQREGTLSQTANAPSRTISLPLAAEESNSGAQAQADSQRQARGQAVDEDSARQERQDTSQVEGQQIPQALPDHRLLHLAHRFMLNRERFSHVDEQWTGGDMRRYMDPLVDAANEFLRGLLQLPRETLQVTGTSLFERYQKLRDTFPHSRADLFGFIRQMLADLAEHARRVYHDAGEPLTFAFTPPARINSIEPTAFFTTIRTQPGLTPSHGSTALRTSASFSLLNLESTEGRTPGSRISASHLGPDTDLNDADFDIANSPLLQHPTPLPAPGSTPYYATMELDAIAPSRRQRGGDRHLLLPEGHWSLPTGNSPPLEDLISVPSTSTVLTRHNRPDLRSARPTRSILRNPSTTAQHRQGSAVRVAEGRTEVPPSPDTSQHSSSSGQFGIDAAQLSSWLNNTSRPSGNRVSHWEDLSSAGRANTSRTFGSRVSDWEDLSSVGVASMPTPALRATTQSQLPSWYWTTSGYRTPPPGYPSTPASRAGSVTPPPGYWSTPTMGSASRSYPPPGYWSTPVSEVTSVSQSAAGYWSIPVSKSSSRSQSGGPPAGHWSTPVSAR
uniref:Uncharacterized protein n=1 Tax=Moniliophthora roreri TaxID=221103 RepID=A0A0W0FAD0_MONRR